MKRVSFPTLVKFFLGQYWFDEWTIGCKAWTRERERIVYYVARGAAEQEIFVFTDFGVPGKISLYDGFINVSVVDKV